MPKLNSALAKEVESSSGTGGFEVIPDGIYPARLKAVTVKEGAKGPYWSWEFELCDTDGLNGRKFWNNTSLSEAARWKMKETFDAFGVPANTDTDEMCGQLVRLKISQTTIQSGAKAGQAGNQIDTVMPHDGGDSDNESDDVPF